MFLKLIALLLCIVYAASEEFVQSVPCANTTIHSVNVRMVVSHCRSSDERCPLYRGHNHTVHFYFEPTMNFMNKTDSRVYGVFEKFSVPYGKKGDACAAAVQTDDSTACTTTGGFMANREYKHTSTFAVSNNYPMIKLKVRFNFYDRRYKTSLMCTEVPVEIMASQGQENQV